MAQEDKTWTVAGTSVQRGEKTLRVANGRAVDRYKVLDKAGCTDICLYDLPQPMTRAEAEAWLQANSDAVPVSPEQHQRTPKTPKEPRAAGLQAGSPKQVPAPVVDENKPVLHDELGFAAAGCSREYWDNMSLLARQEVSRNAAWAVGIECPRGTYPELEAWLEKDGVHVRPDGRLEAAA
jgi:hypothetical protein